MHTFLSHYTYKHKPISQSKLLDVSEFQINFKKKICLGRMALQIRAYRFY